MALLSLFSWLPSGIACNQKSLMNRQLPWLKITRTPASAALLLGLCMALIAIAVPSPNPALADDPNPGILPPNSKPHGNSYAEWSARWWQWLVSIPAATNPNLDATGANCDKGQSGSVWSLAGTFGDKAYTRSCTIPRTHSATCGSGW